MIKTRSHMLKIEPRYDKTHVRGFRPSPTNTMLYSHRRWLEACNLRFRKMWDCTIAYCTINITPQLIYASVFAYAKSSWDRSFRLLLGPPRFNVLSSSASDFQWCCLADQGSPSVMQHIVFVESLSLLLHSHLT